MDRYLNCTSEKFKSDINDLCDKCPLKDQILEGIKNQIVKQAKELKSNMTPSQFAVYINSEIENAKSTMQNSFLRERQNMSNMVDSYRINRIRNYIWNKERIKALNNFSNSLANKSINSDKKKKKLWFDVGLKFAEGTIQQLNSDGLSAPQIVNRLGLTKNHRPYITTTLGNTVNSDKNIYSKSRRTGKMEKAQEIFDYCTKNEIKISKDFLDNYNGH